MPKQKLLRGEKEFLSCFLVAVVLFGGLFYEFLSCIASVALCLRLFFLAQKNCRLIFRVNLCSIAIISISVFYLFSIGWAVDSGMAFLGFTKYLPLPLFLLVLMQEDKPALDALNMLPAVMVLMTLVSMVLMLFLGLRKLIAPAGRLVGFIQYSNTFALFLLIALVLVCMKEKVCLRDYFFLPVFLLNILLSGSRTTFLLTAILIVVLLFLISLSRAMYPWNTDVNVSLLITETDMEIMNARADRILSQNAYVTVAYSAKANYYYAKRGFENMIRYKDNAIENACLSPRNMRTIFLNF